MRHIYFGELPIWLLFDDAQDTYWDTELWAGLFKEVMDLGEHSKVRIVCFASYGSPTYWNNPNRHGTPQMVPPESCMGLFPMESVKHALLFTNEEFDGFMKQRDEQVKSGNTSGILMLDDALKSYIFTSSNGHIGAITGLLHLAATAAASMPLHTLPRAYR